MIDQPPPIKNDRPIIHELVINDLRDRLSVGIERYGTPLQPLNGRNSLIDAYQEVLDLACYLRQQIEEREQLMGAIAHLNSVLASYGMLQNLEIHGAVTSVYELIEKMGDRHEG